MILAVAVSAALAVALWPVSRPVANRSWREAGNRSSRRVGGHFRRPRRRRRAEALDPEVVADALVLVALALQAGVSVVDALDQAAATTSGRVAAELRAVTAALRWGRPTREAWHFADPVWHPAALAFQMAEATGAAPGDLLGATAQRLREGRERDRERRAARAGVLLVLPLGFGFLPAFACTAIVPLVVVLADGVLTAP